MVSSAACTVSPVAVLVVPIRLTITCRLTVHGKPPAGPAHRVALTEAEQGRKGAMIKEYQTKLSPVHDDLAQKFTRAEERFWLVRIE